jgi:hypothetical protein
MDRKKAERQKPRKLKKAQKNVAPVSDITVEATLLAKIDENSHLPDKKQERYWQLRRKREDEMLTDEELTEYQSLVQEWEARNVKRIEALIALAEQRETTLRGVMTELSLKGAEDDS